MKKNKKHRKTKLRRQRQQREEIRQTKEEGTMEMEQQQKRVNADKIRGLMEKEAYAEAINTCADILAEGKEPPESVFGDIARAYFELGDYERAADWVTATLTRTPDHIDVRILLARICQREKRTADALNLYENILRAHKRELSYDQRMEIGRLAGLDARLDPERTRTAYPQLAALLGMGAASAEQSAPAPTQQSTPTVVPVAAPVVPAAPSVATASSVAAEKQAAEILAQEIRPVEKVEALNAFAGAAYASDDYSGAKTLLMAALRLDPGCDMTLRNMALLLHDMGDGEKALQVAAKMRMADFMLLRELKR